MISPRARFVKTVVEGSAVGPDLASSSTDAARQAIVVLALSQACDCWCRIDQRSRVFLARDGHWLASDKRAEDRLVRGISGLTLANGKLQASAALAAELQRLLEAEAQPVTVVLAKTSGEGHVILRSVGFDDDIVCVVINDANGSLEADFAGLEDAFGLTPAETQIVTLMLSGHSAAEVAAERGLSINTVRAHLRHCYEKLGVSSREQLWCKTYPYQIQKPPPSEDLIKTE